MIPASLIPLPRSREVIERVERLQLAFGAFGTDPYGIDKRELAKLFTLLGWFYHHYFSMRTLGIEHVPTRGRAMIVGNHCGGWAIDAAMILAAVFFEMEPPRLAQGMAEKFLARLPFASWFTSRVGQITGLPRHASALLQDERLLMVFPEGARGTAKLFPQRNSLVDFGSGFVRLALENRTPIVPCAFVGGGEAVPTIVNVRSLGRLMGLPYFPLTPYGLPIPLPVACVIVFGEPMTFAGDGNEPDEIIVQHVDAVKARIESLMAIGRSVRQGKPRSSTGALSAP